MTEQPESDNQAKIDREHSVFELQKADVERLLGELEAYAYDIRCDWNDFDGRDLLKYVQGWREEFEAVLDNMEEGEASPCTSTDPRRHECAGFKDNSCLMPERRTDVCYDRHDAAYWARMYEEPPTEEPGCPLSDAMGGAEEPVVEAINNPNTPVQLSNGTEIEFCPKSPAEEPCAICTPGRDPKCTDCPEHPDDPIVFGGSSTEEPGCPLSDAMGSTDPAASDGPIANADAILLTGKNGPPAEEPLDAYSNPLRIAAPAEEPNPCDACGPCPYDEPCGPKEEHMEREEAAEEPPHRGLYAADTEEGETPYTPRGSNRDSDMSMNALRDGHPDSMEDRPRWELEMARKYAEEPEKCPKCGNTRKQWRQVRAWSGLVCADCGERWPEQEGE